MIERSPVLRRESFIGNQICVDKSLSVYGLPDFDHQTFSQHGTGGNARVELAALTTGIDLGRKTVKEVPIET